LILIYPLLLVGAALMIRRSPGRHGAGWVGVVAWAAAGALFTFSLLTGLSIGLFLLPAVVLALAIAVRVAPEFSSALGFVAGIAVMTLAIVVVHLTTQ